ncbi:hypothetical protein AHAS_Ahas11G0105000 [Arachis hypogaea]
MSLGGAKYLVSFIDDYSRRIWMYQIKKKSDVFAMFKEFKAKLELESGKKIKCLRTHNGGEYVNSDFLTFCKQAGIQRQFTVTYTPDKPLFYGLSCANLSGFYQLFTHLFILFA